MKVLTAEQNSSSFRPCRWRLHFVPWTRVKLVDKFQKNIFWEENGILAFFSILII